MGVNTNMKEIYQEIKNNEFVRILLYSIGDGVFVLDTKGTIIAWNPAMEKITGYKAEEVTGKSCSILSFSKCFGKECPNGFNDCGIVKYGSVEPTECLLRHKNGCSVSVTKNARVIRKEDGTIVGVIEAVTDLTELKNIRLKMEEATRRLGELSRLGGIIGKSHLIQNVFSSIKASAASDTTIFIHGESGTGKELAADVIHSISERRDKSLVMVNCSALSESLLESELFGHVKGAFTGAFRDRTGRFEEADGGTIFLDEIGDISPYIQMKLLRVLQQRKIERVGESKKRKIDIRIITATNKDLNKFVKEGSFREDLYYRLKVFPIYLPPLRQRKEDIPLLVNHFIKVHNRNTGKNIKSVSQAVMKAFFDHAWPGNVRELGNAIEHAFVLCAGEEIDVQDLPVEILKKEHHPIHSERSIEFGKKVFPGKNLTRKKLLALLNECEWNKAEVARRVGLSRASIWKYMKKWDIPLQKIS